MTSGDDRQSPPASGADPNTMVGDELVRGAIVKGSYRVLEFIGEGGAGAVYAAEHVSLGHRVAIKTLFGKFVRDDGMRRRFIEEAIIQANLNHPNIVKVIDVLDEPPLSAIFMEYVEGSSLDRHLTRLSEPEPVTRTALLFLPVLEAMSYAHAQGVVHRDIKPANIMLTRGRDGAVPKVTDFGIAKVLSDHRRTETGTAMGTVYYAAPEQLTDAKSVDHRADVYSLGCTLYEMLTLELPFEDATMFGVMQKHVQAPRPDPSRANADVPRELAGLVMRAMAVRPDHRFETCAEFGAELRRVMGFAATDSSYSGLAPIPRTPGDSVSRPDVPISTGPATRGPNTPTGRPPATLRTAGRVTHPGTIDAPSRPAAKERNAVSLVIWVAIGVLSLGLVLALVVGGGRSGEEEVPTADVGTARPTPVRAAPAAVVEGTGEGTAEPAEEPAEAPVAPVEPESTNSERITECYALPDRYLDFDPLGEVSYADALADLRDNAEPCGDLLEENATEPFERAMAFLAGVQTRAVYYDLLARRAAGLGEAECEDALVAVTEAHRGLRRIDEAARSGELLAYEVQSLDGFRDALTHVYVGLMTGLPECPYVTIPEELLGAEAAVLLAVPEAKPAPAAASDAEGSAEPETEVLTP